MKEFLQAFFIGIIIVTGLLIFFSAIVSSKEETTVYQLKYDKCVSEMQKAIPDPNDTKERSDFLKACY